MPHKASPKADSTKFPLVLLALVVLGYILVGWHLSAYPWMWSAYACILAAILTVVVVWGTSNFFRSMQMGPRSVVTMLILSTIVTLFVNAFAIFSLIAILMSSETLVRIEMRAAGYRNWQIMIVIMQMAILGVFIGWTIGRYLLPQAIA
ncbi:hypothetical protein [Parathermosynechococcus lividus]|jgi:hypothetical protein|nr:hypothetical protein [Synechococcus sp. PCC 6716]